MNQASSNNKIHTCLFKSNDNGFTLIEILIAILIFSIGILAVSSLQLNSIKGNTHANSFTIAGSTASNHSENLKALPFNDPLLDEGLHPAQPLGRLWVGWNVTSNVPLNPISEDTDGKPIDPYSICKTIEIVVFSNSMGFDDPTKKNRLFACSLIKTRRL
ncbi:MAG: prepilin-type N-terminal cleavage/methylation domain-containing protein [Desulfobacteraceae bacterium]|jgi:prepilin-type N-terminal cleavage/methylation domain-containing protein